MFSDGVGKVVKVWLRVIMDVGDVLMWLVLWRVVVCIFLMYSVESVDMLRVMFGLEFFFFVLIVVVFVLLICRCYVFVVKLSVFLMCRIVLIGVEQWCVMSVVGRLRMCSYLWLCIICMILCGLVISYGSGLLIGCRFVVILFIRLCCIVKCYKVVMVFGVLLMSRCMCRENWKELFCLLSVKFRIFLIFFFVLRQCMLCILL